MEIRRTFTAPREKVFQAWMEPRLLLRWFLKRTPQHETRMLQWQAWPGGKYRFEVVAPETGQWHTLTGAFLEIQLPERLVFTWRWESQPDFPESKVTVEFRLIGASDFTEVTLKHALLPETARERHRQGWNDCFNTLEQALQEAAR